ncbi:MAG: PilZ domain-containing protein, partial [Halioglobus sp.]|nr:PilZ domain-containing protein [Halioglobus sp.]
AYSGGREGLMYGCDLPLEYLARNAGADRQRMQARFAQRLDIEFNGIQELESTLDDISAGGLRITVPDPLPVGQSLQTVISTLDEKCSLKLRARVVGQKAIKLAAGEFYHVGLKFEHPAEELNKRVQQLITQVATIEQS